MTQGQKEGKVHPMNKPLIILHARRHDEGSMRVWRTDWPGDVFEIVSNEEFEGYNEFLGRFNLPQIEELSQAPAGRKNSED